MIFNAIAQIQYNPILQQPFFYNNIMRIVFLLLLLTSISSLAQPRLEKHFAHKLYTTYEGLAQSQVTYMIHDSKGYICICTKGGLTRYHGKEFVNFIDETIMFVPTKGHETMFSEANNLFKFHE